MVHERYRCTESHFIAALHCPRAQRLSTGKRTIPHQLRSAGRRRAEHSARLRNRHRFGKHLIRSRHLGIPTDNRESFAILQREGFLTDALAQRLKAMVGFRNLAVDQYRELNIDIVEHILMHELDDLLAFADKTRTLV